MAKKKSAKQEYNRQRRRVQRLIASMSERGYYGVEEQLPAVPKKITQASVRRLKKITLQSLAAKSEYAGELTYGEVTTGKHGLSLERKESAKKAQVKRMEKRNAKGVKRISDRVNRRLAEQRKERQHYDEDMRRRGYAQDASTADQLFERQRRQQDEQELHRLETDTNYQAEFSQYSITTNNLYSAADAIGRNNPYARDAIYNILNEAEGKVSDSELADNVGKNGDNLIALTDSLGKYGEGSNAYVEILIDFYEMVMNESPSAQQISEWSDVSERYESW